jgi:type II secretory pathway pseudopilin PulG
MPTRSRLRTSQVGFTYLWVLVAIALLGLGLAAASELWVSRVRREKLAELDWIGVQFTQAIGSYYYATPGAARAYPMSLQDLLEDKRHLTVRRHLRAIYPNPFTGRADWEPVLGSDGRVRGVRAQIPGDGAGTSVEFVYRPTNE